MPFNPRLFFWVLVDAIKGKLGLSPVFIQAIGRPGEFSFIRTPSAYPGAPFRLLVQIISSADLLQGFVAMFAQGRTPFTEAPNLINPRVCLDIMNARPGTLLRKAHAPFLVVVSQEDDMLPVSIGRSVAAGAPDGAASSICLPLWVC